MTALEANLRLVKSRHSEAESGVTAQAVWVRRARQGDTAAFDQLMRAHQQRVFSTAWRLLGHREDAQDAVQEVFLRLFRYLDRMDAARPLAPWLYRITINVSRDLSRRRRKRSTQSLDSIQEESGLEVKDPAADPAQQSAIREETELVEEALRSLPFKERSALVLRDVEGLTTAEVAAILGSSDVTVRSQICRARLNIKKFCDQRQKGAMQ